MTTDEMPVPAEQERLPRIWAPFFLALGMTCGLFAHVTLDQFEAPALRFAFTQFFLLAPLLFVLGVRPGREAAAAILSLALPAVLGLLSASTIGRFGPEQGGSGFLMFTLVGQSLLFCYIALPFLQTWLGEGRFSFPYQQLVVHAWNNGLQALVGLAFAGCFWLILYLFALLFASVGIEALEDLIEERMFWIPAISSVTALGIFLARDHARIVAALRNIAFSLFSVLTPVFLLLALGFLAALVFEGLERLSSVFSASAVLLILIAIGIHLTNAVIRDGSEMPAAHRLLRLTTIALQPALLCFCGFAAYAISLRVGAYGLTPERVWILIGTGIVSLHSLAYVLSLALRDHWMTVCRRANVLLALLVAAVALAMQTPLADPAVLSARSQQQRLTGGDADPESFDYGFLNFKLGNPGLAALAEIAADSGVASREIVAEKLDRLESADSYWAWWQSENDDSVARRAAILEDRGLVQRLPADLAIPDSHAIAELPDFPLRIDRCAGQGERECLLVTLDLTDSSGDELVFATRVDDRLDLVLLERTDSGWNADALLYTKFRLDLWKALKSGEFSTVPADHRDLKIGDSVIRLRAPTNVAPPPIFSPGKSPS